VLEAPFASLGCQDFPFTVIVGIRSVPALLFLEIIEVDDTSLPSLETPSCASDISQRAYLDFLRFIFCAQCTSLKLSFIAHASRC